MSGAAFSEAQAAEERATDDRVLERVPNEGAPVLAPSEQRKSRSRSQWIGAEEILSGRFDPPPSACGNRTSSLESCREWSP